MKHLVGPLMIALLVAARSAQAASALEEGLGRLAEKVAAFIETEANEKAVTVGDFVAPPRLKASGGPGISLLLQRQFQKFNIEVREKAPYQLLGQFTVREERESSQAAHDSVALRLTATLLDRNDEELRRISISIFGIAALQLTGDTVDLSSTETEAEHQEAIGDSFDNPSAAIVEAETRASQSSAFGVEIRVRRGTTEESDARIPEIIDGRSFVKLDRGEEYIVRLHNRASFEAAVALTIDGLGMFAFTEEDNDGSQVLVSPGSFVDIPGWYVTNQKSDAFVITSYAKSAAASRNVVSGLGTITASFHAAWDPSGEPPADEVGARGSDEATGRGRLIEQKYVEVPRVIGRVRSVVSVRYDR